MQSVDLTHRQKVAFWILVLASWLKFLAKIILPKNKTIIVDVLTLSGWFIMDGHMIHQENIEGKMIDFTWHTYTMPDQYLIMLEKLKRM